MECKQLGEVGAIRRRPGPPPSLSIAKTEAGVVPIFMTLPIGDVTLKNTDFCKFYITNFSSLVNVCNVKPFARLKFCA